MNLALNAASLSLMEVQALFSPKYSEKLEVFVPLCCLSLNPGGDHRAEATWRKPMNFLRPSTPRSTSAPALSCPQQGSSRETSHLKGARATCSAKGCNTAKGEFARPGSSPPPPAAECRLELSRLMTRSSAENGLEGSKTAAITASEENGWVSVSVSGWQSRSQIWCQQDDVENTGCPETVFVCC